MVATEVRNLATRSASAAKEIKELIGDSVARVEEGAVLASDAGRTMSGILVGVREVAALMNEISLASQEQRSGIGQVSQTLMQMEKMTQQNAALVEQASAAMAMLEAQAGSLVDAVRVFKLDESDAGEYEPRSREVANPELVGKSKLFLRNAVARRRIMRRGVGD